MKQYLVIVCHKSHEKLTKSVDQFRVGLKNAQNHSPLTSKLYLVIIYLNSHKNVKLESVRTLLKLTFLASKEVSSGH